MVFEALVVELLNKILKQYVQNLDTSQLKIGIWGGDVVLNNLKIKTTLFDDLDLPIKVKWGILGKFSLKIPWKNVYSSNVVVDIEELLMIIVPFNEFKYDAAKEEKWANDKKQAKLRAVEEARKREIENDTVNQSDGFMEKLLTQIIKNLQILIRNIHIRYEDQTTNPNFPFSVGLTMSNLSITTCINPSENEAVLENYNIIYKIIHLDGFAIYWNSNSNMFSELDDPDLINALLDSIPKNNYKPKEYFYVFGPLSASASLQLNPKPEIDGSDFKIPKLLAKIHLKEIDLALNHRQFYDALLYTQNYQRLSAGAKYRKYRPVGITVIGHAKEWWMFAYNGVAEDIRRRKREWSWIYIQKHRMMCRKYSSLYEVKLNSKKISSAITVELQSLEKELNLFNILLLREQAYVQIERSNLEKSCSKISENTGWFSNWFGYNSNTKSNARENDLVKKFESVMTSNEKAKLYKAIGYNESDPLPNYPAEYVEIEFLFQLDEIKATISEQQFVSSFQLVSLSLKTINMRFERRPSTYGMKFEMSIGKLEALGIQDENDKIPPELIKSNCGELENLVEILYETKPLNGDCDQRIHVHALPLKIVYHAETINTVRSVFFNVIGEDLQNVVSVPTLPAFRRITAMGLQYAIEKRTVFEVKINIMPSYLIIPYGGYYDKNKEMLVIMFGKLSIETEENEKQNVNIKKLYLKGNTEQEIFSTVLSASYTNFKCKLIGVQILLQLAGEDWLEASNISGKSPMRFLETSDLVFIIKKSLVSDDPTIPKIICEGQLPSLIFNFSEDRFVAFAELIFSIPMKKKEDEIPLKKSTAVSAWSLHSFTTQLENKFGHIAERLPISNSIYVQGIDFFLRFEMKELLIIVFKTKHTPSSKSKISIKSKDAEDKFLKLRLVRLETELTCKTFEMISNLKLGGIEFHQYCKNQIVPFVTTKGLQHDSYFFESEHTNVNTVAPNFRTERESIVNRLTLYISPINVVFHKEALLDQLWFFNHIKNRLNVVQENCGHFKVVDAGKPKEANTYLPFENFNEGKTLSKGKKFRKKLPKKEIIDFFLNAKLEEMNVLVESKNQKLAKFSIKEGSFDITTQKSYTNVDFKLCEIILNDLNPDTVHKKIVESLEKQTFFTRITIFNSEYYGQNDCVDMSLEAEFGGLRCTFLHVFFLRIQNFLLNFQKQFERLKEGAAVAAQRAKDNVMKAYQNSSKIFFDVKITAPFIVIPITSKSLEALVIDLGVLTVKNQIAELNYPQEGDINKRPIIDNMRFHLQNLKFSRCVLESESLKVCNEKIFLTPVSFELSIKRNLSTSWFKVIPEFEILARLASIRVSLSHEDLCNIVDTLKNNMNEGSIKNFKENIKVKKNLISEGLPKDRGILWDEEISEDNAENNENSNFYTVVKFVFFMDSFIFDALSTDNDKANSLDDDDNNDGLARFVLETISLKGKMFSNGSVDTSLLLVSCLLDDTRPGKKDRLTRLMESSESNLDILNSDTKANKSMVEISYKSKGNDSFVDIRVFKFTLILSMDFLHKLKEFFTINTSNKVHDYEGYDPSTTIKSIENKARLLIEEGHERPPTFTLNLKVEKPDIIIVENMDSIDTEALIFHTEIVVKYRFAGIRQIIAGTLGDIELYSCCFNPKKRRNTLSQVIRPFTISVAGSTPLGQGLHIDIFLTEILISVNPATVELMSKCYEVLFLDSSVNKSNLEEDDFSDLWIPEYFEVDDFWFLKIEQGEEALYSFSKSSSTLLQEKKELDEICLLAIPSIIILVEGIAAKQFSPMLLLKMGFQLECTNWSSKLSISSTLSLEFQYYNKILTAWEPLIEPVEILENKEKKKKHSYVPWEINFLVAFGEDAYLEALEPPKMTMSLSCPEILPITLTKTGVEVLKNVLDTYTSAVTKGIVSKHSDLPPFIVRNETELIVELLLDESDFEVCKADDNKYTSVKLESNSEVELQTKSSKISEFKKICLLDGKSGLQLHAKFPIVDSKVFEIPLNIASKRYYSIPIENVEKKKILGLVADLKIQDVTATLTLRSNVKIFNFFNEPIHIHSLTEKKDEAVYIGVVEGNSEFSLPFHVVQNKNEKLFFSANGYRLSSRPFSWENIEKQSSTCILLQCNAKTPENRDPFFIKAVGEIEEIYLANTNRKTNSSINYSIYLQPTIKILNCLPVDLVICFQGSAKEQYLRPGNILQITCAEPGNSVITLRINDYLEKEWSTKEAILENPPEFSIWKFVSYNGLSPETINLGVHCTFIQKTAVYSVYSPYFMVNKTGHLLSYRFDGNQTVFHHPENMKMPVMFSPTFKKFFSKKSAFVKINYSNWSEKFPVDVAGSGGTVKCVDTSSNMVYHISVSISLTSNSLTKIITFTPYYVFINETNYTIECQEIGSSDKSWVEIPDNSCFPFWPKLCERSKIIQIRPKDSNGVSPPFDYSGADACLLKLNHKLGGIFVNIEATQYGTYITFSSYEDGQAPVLIINYSNTPINLIEVNTDFQITLNPHQKVYHAWISPTGSRKISVINPKHVNDEIDLEQDNRGEILTEKGETVQYLTFIDGIQRILLFNCDIGLSSSISNFLTISTGIELICEFQGIGISVVNNINRTEILYISLLSSGVVWEIKKINKTRYKPVKEDDSEKIEVAYMKYHNDTEINNKTSPVIHVTDKIKVNFETMQMLEPHKRVLRRTFKPGLWIAYRVMEDQIMINLKINKVQIDNQLQDFIFPVILSPVPPPKTVSNLNQEAKPFFELSIVKKAADSSGVEQYKYFEILVQEFTIKIDIGFLQQFWLFLAPEKISDEEQKIRFLRDLNEIEKPLIAHVEVISSSEQKNYYEFLHFSPVKIHFSFSLAGTIDSGSLPPFFNVMFQSVGVTLTDVHDVIFRLSYFERKCIVFTKSQLLKEVISHYYGQTIRQAYVLLLGLDVIGNPFGLIVGIKEGVEAFFYEPFQGMVHGPSEFATGVAIGCKSLFGHTVGSTAGTLQKLTDTLGKGLAVLSLDKEYQIRRMAFQSHQENIQASMARGGRDLVMGLFEGVTGVVKKPLEGAKQEGVGGFIKGMGKGMMGLFMRPVTGVVDFTSTSLNVVKRATGPNFETKRLRPPRFFRDDQLIEPYNLNEAIGNTILYYLCAKRRCSDDKYVFHIMLKQNEVAVFTNKRMILAELNEFFGTWKEHMSMSWKSMPNSPYCHSKGIGITLSPKSESLKPEVKILLIPDKEMKMEICNKMKELYKLEKEEEL